MADNTQLNTGTGGDVVASDDIGGVKFQRVKLVHGADGVNDGDVAGANPLPTRETYGTFSYQSATLTSGTLVLTGRVVGLRVYAHTADGSFTINGGSAVTVREGTGFDWTPRTPCVSPTITWISGTLDVFVELAN